MEPTEALIPVRSETQAMDWSLVLVSQGIETAIHKSPEDGRVFLAVAPEDRPRSLAAIRQYERENRRRSWRQPLPKIGMVMDWRVLFCLAPLVLLFCLTDVAGMGALKAAGIMDSAAVRRGEWWRLLTAVTLHADAGHLASNLATGALLMGLAMGAYGAGAALLACILAGVGGNAAGLLLLPGPHRSLGASGMVLGALGLLTVNSLRLWRDGHDARRLVWQAVAAGGLLLVLLGLNPQTDVLAHVGGFVCGAFGGLALVFLPEKWTRSDRADQAAGWTALLLALGAWAWALT